MPRVTIRERFSYMGVEQVGIPFVMCIEVETTVSRLTLSGGTPLYNASQGQNDTSLGFANCLLCKVMYIYTTASSFYRYGVVFHLSTVQKF